LRAPNVSEDQCTFGRTATSSRNDQAEFLGRPLRVLHLIAYGNLAGTEMSAARLAMGQAARGLQPAVAILYGGGPIEKILERGGVPTIHIGAMKRRVVLVWRRLLDVIRTTRPDVLHAHDLRWWSAILGRIAHRGPHVLTIHNQMVVGRDAWRWRLKYRIARWTYSVFVGVSAATLQSVRGAVNLPASRCAVIPNGIPVADFRPREGRAAYKTKLGCPPDAPVIGLIGRQTQQKGVVDFLATCCEILQQEPRARFWVLGDGEDLARHTALARDLGLADHVTFWGNQTNVQEWLGAMDVYLMTSRWEPFGLVVLEAMAAGVPVLGFIPEAGGLLEVVRNGETAILLPQRDPVALARLALTTLRDQAFREWLTAAALGDVKQRFDLSVMAEGYMALYARLSRQRTVECGERPS